MTGRMLEIRDLRFRHGVAGGFDSFTLDIPALSLDAGEFVGCIGSSGSGKTTLLHLIAGVLTPDDGSIRIEGKEIVGLSDRERRRIRLTGIGMVFQEFELLEYVSAAENIGLAHHLGAGTTPHELQTRARELVDAAGIGAVVGRKPAALSQGERQRVALCRALATSPPLVLSDEPTGNLDPVSAERMLGILEGEARDRGAAVLVVTHNHTCLDRFDRVLDMATLTRRGVPS